MSRGPLSFTVLPLPRDVSGGQSTFALVFDSRTSRRTRDLHQKNRCPTFVRKTSEGRSCGQGSPKSPGETRICEQQKETMFQTLKSRTNIETMCFCKCRYCSRTLTPESLPLQGRLGRRWSGPLGTPASTSRSGVLCFRVSRVFRTQN